MANGYSIHIGLNGVDPTSYNGWPGTLAGCVNDANAMKAICDSLGYSSSQLLNGDATSSAVIQQIGRAAQQMNGEDILVITYSGHGGIVDDATSDDGKDETWVMYDRMVLDKELAQLWGQFADGARIFVLSDSCHSGTVTRDLILQGAPGAAVAAALASGSTSSKEAVYSQMLANTPLLTRYRGPSQAVPKFRCIPQDVQDAVYKRDREVYSTRQWAAVTRSRSVGGATVLLISGCQDNQLSADGDGNGLFTGTLLQVWAGGVFDGDYVDFCNQIISRMPGTQTPNYFPTGPSNPAFEAQRPFTVEAATPIDRTSVVSGPKVQGPASVSRGGAPPRFQVSTGANRFYIFEATSDPALFDAGKNSGLRNSTNFYGSWQDDGGSHIVGTNTSYTLPASVWSNLQGAATLYYRVGTMSGATGFQNYVVSTYDTDGRSAPHFDLVGARAAAMMAG